MRETRKEERQRTKQIERGITLIALVITIIVLLILAGVAISMLSGENGILNQAAKAKTETEEKSTEEAVKLAVTSAMTNVNHSVDEATLKKELTNAFGAEGTGYTITEDGENGWTVEVNDVEYKVTSNGSVSEKVDLTKALERFTENPDNYKHPDQKSTNEDRAIGTDGKPVNMDLWKVTKMESTAHENHEGEAYLSDYAGSSTTPGYSNDNIVEGKIKGTVPQYVYLADDDKVYTITNMYRTFYECTNLQSAPEIPSSVTEMGETFNGCTSLQSAPKIPIGVTNLMSTFLCCTNLQSAPEIPVGVTSLQNTFSGCTNLQSAPEIPIGVTKLYSTFEGCTSLQSAPEIPVGVIELGSTFSGCTNLQSAPEIPSSVGYMSTTFSRLHELKRNSKN